MPGWWHRVIANKTREYCVNFPRYSPNLWYGVTGYANLGVVFADSVFTGALSLDNVAAFSPLSILHDSAFDAFGFNIVTQTGPNETIRAGIYTVRDNYETDAFFAGSPLRKVVDFGSFVIGGPGNYEITCPRFWLDAGDYWFVFNRQAYGGNELQFQALVPYNSGSIGPDVTSGRPPFMFGSTGAGDPFGVGPTGNVSFISIFDWGTYPTLPVDFPDLFGGVTLLWEPLQRTFWLRASL